MYSFPITLLLFFLTLPVFGVSSSKTSCEKYQRISDQLVKLAKQSKKETELFIGFSANSNPIYMVRIGKPGKTSQPRPAIYISAAIHGNEYQNIGDRLAIRWLSERSSPQFNQFYDQGGLIYILPIANPDGFCQPNKANDTLAKRFNGQGKDLNRDFPLQKTNFSGLTQPETRFIVRTLSRDLKRNHGELVLSWDYHCCLKPGRLLYPWGYRNPRFPDQRPNPLTERAIQAHIELANLVKNISGYNHGTPWEQEYVPGTILGGVQGASDDYFYETYFLKPNSKFIGRAFTFEGETNESSKFPLHVKIWQALFEKLLAEQNPDQFAENSPSETDESR